jgi:hypothetical protein
MMLAGGDICGREVPISHSVHRRRLLARCDAVEYPHVALHHHSRRQKSVFPRQPERREIGVPTFAAARRMKSAKQGSDTDDVDAQCPIVSDDEVEDGADLPSRRHLTVRGDGAAGRERHTLVDECLCLSGRYPSAAARGDLTSRARDRDLLALVSRHCCLGGIDGRLVLLLTDCWLSEDETVSDENSARDEGNDDQQPD